MSSRLTDKFTDDAIPPFDAPTGVLAWIELPTGNVYLQSDFQWIDREDLIRSRILNNCLKVLAPGPAEGPLIAYHCMFVRIFYGHRYPVYQRIVAYLDDADTVY